MALPWGKTSDLSIYIKYIIYTIYKYIYIYLVIVDTQAFLRNETEVLYPLPIPPNAKL